MVHFPYKLVCVFDKLLGELTNPKGGNGLTGETTRQRVKAVIVQVVIRQIKLRERGLKNVLNFGKTKNGRLIQLIKLV